MALDRLTQITNSGITSTIVFRASGINVSGIVTATTFVGDGSGLTGVVGSGSGIVVKDSGSTVGTAGTIDFGSNLSVSAISSGIVTVTASSDISGPGSSTDNAVTRFDGTTGKLIQNSLVTIGDDGAIVAPQAGSIIPFYFDNQSAFPSASTYHGAIVHSHADGAMYYAHGGVWIRLADFSDIQIGSSSQFVTTSAGIHTLSNVGIGTTNPTSKLTVSGDVNISGIVTANSFVGDGSGLIGVIGSGSGIVVKDSGSTVGTAGTIDFGDNLTVSAISAGVVTVTAAGSTSQFVTTSAGIHTLSNVGIGTTNPTSKLTVSGNVLVSGIVTANSFVGDGSGLTGVIGSGSGIVVKDSGSTIGTAETIDFGDNLSVSAISAGVVTVTAAAGGSESLTSLNVSGISTLGTVQVSSGIITATSGTVTYYGDTSNTTDGRWILGANGSSDYTFTGIGFIQTTNDPVLYLARGRVYEFVNNSGGSHPFQIRVSNGGAAYNDGVTNNGAASGTIRFEIPFNAPNTLYYQCTSHSSMGNTINVYPSI
jgi:hypothetical protein